MSAPALAQGAYRTQMHATRAPRDTEYDLLARITGRLRQAAADRGVTAFPALAAAMHENRRLWTAFAVDLADPGNALPRDLRARLFHLSEFVSVHTDRVLAGEARPEALIEVNLAVMRGLHGGEGAA